MMGWLLFAVIAALTGGVLLLIGFPRRLWTIPATAMALGATGYALQGSPALPGHPVEAAAEEPHEIDPGIVAIREAMFGRFNLEDGYFRLSDAALRGGGPAMQALAMRGAVAKVPYDVALWTWYGVALAQNDHDLVSPSARFAFDRALALAPRHAGPPFFLGYAYMRGGQLVEARKWWARSAEVAPEGSIVKKLVTEQLAMLDCFIAVQQGAQPAP